MQAQILYSVILSVSFLSITGIILASLLVLAEKKILNFGPCKISINENEKEFTVQGGSSLLSSLADNNLFIPSACGGRGSCAYCKVTVDAGGGAITPVEEPYLSAQEKANNVRLSCQVKIRGDIAIKITKEIFSVKKYRALVVHKKNLTHDIVELRIQLIEPDTISFFSGQYVQLTSQEYKGKEAVIRAYSISSLPSDNKFIELIVRKVPTGICSVWVTDILREKQEIELSGPFGEFHLSGNDAPIIFIAGGSGMAPIWSMIRNMVETGSTRKAAYFFGALSQKDLFYTNELNEISRRNPWFSFIPALSSEPADSDWKGERGLITAVVAKYFPDTSSHEAYLCGSPGMINACITVLTNSGMPQGNIYFDKFA